MALSYSNNTITISLASLASSATFVAGVESTQIDNTSNLFLDAIVYGTIMVGTTPTAGVINVYVWGSYVSLGTTPLDVLDGTDSAETLTNAGILQTTVKQAATAIVTATTSNVGMPFAPFSVAAKLGLLVLPQFWGLFVAHNTVAALHATGGNHVFKYDGIKY